MSKLKNSLIVGGLLATIGASIAVAHANNEQTDDAVMQSAKITIEQAIKAVADKTGGKIASADFDVQDKGSEPFYKIEVIGVDGKEQELAVNAMTGEVTAAPADEDGSEGGND